MPSSVRVRERSPWPEKCCNGSQIREMNRASSLCSARGRHLKPLNSPKEGRNKQHAEMCEWVGLCGDISEQRGVISVSRVYLSAWQYENRMPNCLYPDVIEGANYHLKAHESEMAWKISEAHAGCLRLFPTCKATCSFCGLVPKS